jgi:hypothetical protein
MFSDVPTGWQIKPDPNETEKNAGRPNLSPGFFLPFKREKDNYALVHFITK